MQNVSSPKGQLAAQGYCPSVTGYQRWKTREVYIGDVPVGGGNPIRLQSMTTTDTMDTRATVEQCIRIIEAGADYVRITAPSIREAENLKNIKEEIRARGYRTPLIADIHFTPNAAEIAARIVEKVRINPGNYADRKKFQLKEYSDLEYEAELERIRKRFTPLVRLCKYYGTAMRIGANHGSLSDRIMSRYGDTPLGMVESALEFVRICEDEGYHDIVLSMKSSNPIVMIEAYRLLVHKMMEEGMNYPLHIGVTEAGDGMDGRIKSAVGIGTLLEEGLGDTVRVSLTEDPEYEIPVARKLVERYANRPSETGIPAITTLPHNPFEYEKRKTLTIDKIGSENPPVIVADISFLNTGSPEDLLPLGYRYIRATDKWGVGDMAPDYLYCGTQPLPYSLPGSVKQIVRLGQWESREDMLPLLLPDDLPAFASRNAPGFLLLDENSFYQAALLDRLASCPNLVLVLDTDNPNSMAAMRRMCMELRVRNIMNPVILRRHYNTSDPERLMVHAATDIGGILTDGYGDGIWITAQGQETGFINQVAFTILQATRTRISKTEYIACPSCGRTLFDLQETTARIRRQTQHLKGIKIGIMGCIVNGPGEMADADYGYVGSGPGKVTLYRGKEIVKRHVDTEHAVEELINLIREDGNWIDPPEE